MVVYEVRCEIDGGKVFYSVFRGERIGRYIKWQRDEVFSSRDETFKYCALLSRCNI